MRKLTVHNMVSLDGVMQAPGGPEEDPTGGFDHGGWAAPFIDESVMDRINAAPPYDLLLGRGTYEIFAAHWPYDEGPVADRLNKAQKHVASTALDELEWDNSVLIEGDVAAYVRRLKEGDGPEIQVHGSHGLIQTLLENDLVDEFDLWFIPVVLGKGKRLFGSGAMPVAMELAESVTFATGVVISVYRRAGSFETGSAGFDEPTERELERRRRLAG